MENYSNPEISGIVQAEGNTVCIDCGAEKPNMASMNNGVFLCQKCAGIHRSFGISISLVRSLQEDTWTEKQLLYLKKGGNNNFIKNLNEFNIDLSSVSLEVKYKSEATHYYRKYLKNEVEKESDSNYVPVQITKPEIGVAQDIVEIQEENNEENKEEKKEEKKEENKEENKNENKEENQKNEKKEEKTETKSFLGFMGSVFNKVKDTTTSAAKSVEKGLNDLKIGEKLKVAGEAIAGVVVTSGNYIADKTQQAVNSEFVQNISKKGKEGVNTIVEKTKSVMTKDTKNKEEEKKEENKEENKQNEEKKEAEADNNVLVKENNIPQTNSVPEEKTAPADQNPQEQTQSS